MKPNELKHSFSVTDESSIHEKVQEKIRHYSNDGFKYVQHDVKPPIEGEKVFVVEILFEKVSKVILND